ncbi:MAG: hypothetical protein AAB929_06100 [Patescibacteria group bacterium]
MDNLTSKDWIALCAVIVSIFAVGWNIFNEIYRKLPKIKITARRVTMKSLIGTEEEHVGIFAVNEGKVSCVLMQAGFETKKGFFQIFPGPGRTAPDWSGKIEPYHTHTVVISRDLLVKNGIPPPFEGAYVIDSTGKKYRARKGMGNK